MSTETKTVYTAIQQSGKPVLVKIGTATINADGSMTVKLDALPTNGKITIKRS